jgi:acyl-CoA reductase-like NAD-dependent aldehyde dehydrogenase
VVELLDRPWGPRGAGTNAATGNSGREALALTLGAAVFAVATGWYAAGLAKLEWAKRSLDVERRALVDRAEPALKARDQALAELAAVRALRSLQDEPDQLSLMARTAQLLPQNGTALRDWDYQDGKLRLVVVAPNRPLASEFVKSFQAAGPFRNVTASSTPDPNGLVLSMDVAAEGAATGPTR